MVGTALSIHKTKEETGHFRAGHRAVVAEILVVLVADRVEVEALVDPAVAAAILAVVELAGDPEAVCLEVELWVSCQRREAHGLTALLRLRNKDRARQIPPASWTRRCVTLL